MKQTTQKKKLTLNKETISELKNLELKNVKGGGSFYWTCSPCDTLFQSCVPCYIRDSFGTAC